MELYTKRYNLYNYLIRDDFDYISTNEYIYLWRNNLIILFAILIMIFIYHFNNFDLFALFIVTVIVILIYFIYFDVTSYFKEVTSDKYLLNYKNYYETMNILFMENFDFTKDDDFNDKKKVVNKPLDLISLPTEILIKYNSSIVGNYLQILVDEDDYLYNFLRNNFFLYETTIQTPNVYIKVDDLNMKNDNIKIDKFFITSSPEYKYLTKNPPVDGQKYFITSDNYFKFEISKDPLTDEYQMLKFNIIEKMYYLFIKSIGDIQNPNTNINANIYTITVDDINKKNDKLISSIATLYNSRTFTRVTFENSGDNYEYSPTQLKLKITDKQGLINYIKANQYYDYTDTNFTDDVEFLKSISYEGVYENTPTTFKININPNDAFYNNMIRDYDYYANAYILNGGKTFIDTNTNDIYSMSGRMYFNIGKFFDTYSDNYANINPELRAIPEINQFYTSLYQSGLVKRYSLKTKDDLTELMDNNQPPIYNEDGVNFKPGNYLKIPKKYYDINSSKVFTFSFSFKTNDNGTIMEFMSNDGFVKFRLKKEDNNLFFDINIGSADKEKRYSSSKKLDFSKWHNVVIIIDLTNKEKSSFSFYVDGETIEENKEPFFFLIALAVAAGVAASRQHQPSYDKLEFKENKIGNFNGMMKNLRIYNKKLTINDVKNINSLSTGIIISNDFIRKYKDIYIYSYLRTSAIVYKSGVQLVINKSLLAQYKGQTTASVTFNEYIRKIDTNLYLFDKNKDIIIKKTGIIRTINTDPRIVISISFSKLNDSTVNEYRNSFIKNIIFERLIPYINEKTREITINEVIDGIRNSTSVYLKINYSSIYNNRHKLEFDHPYIYNQLLKTTQTSIEADINSNYWDSLALINSISEETRKVYLKIKTIESNFKDGNYNRYIYDLMERINYGERINNKFLNELSVTDVESFKILLSYYNIKHKIKKNIRFIENKSFDEINFNDYTKDILKFIDIYNDVDINVLKKFLFVRADTKIPNIMTYGEDRKVVLKDNDDEFKEEKLADLIKEVNIQKDQFTYYLINLEKLNKIEQKEIKFDFMTPFMKTLNDKYKTDIKNLDDLYKPMDVKQHDGIAKIIENYNYIYIKVIIIILILITIIFHVFYQEFIKYIR